MSSSSPPLVPALDVVTHFVLCDFGGFGRAYVETDPADADERAIVRKMISGQYDRPLRVLACNPAQGWARDVSEQIARTVSGARAPDDLTVGVRRFLQAHLENVARS